MNITARQVERFGTLLTRRFGLVFGDNQSGKLRDTLVRRIEATREPFESYLAHLGNEWREEANALAAELTTPETYFFRNADQFRALSERVIPERLASRPGGLRLLSAGCASGEEPYTLAMVTRGLPELAGVSIAAVDLNPAVLEKAMRGRYSSWALRETPADMVQRWFSEDDRDFVLDVDIRSAVRFAQCNLVEADRELWQQESYDVIFCRNVLMYFTPEHARSVVANITRALVPGGYLFIGHAENLRGISSDFHLCHTNGTFYYQRRDGQRGVGSSGPREAAAPPVPSLEPALDATSWVEAIARASARIHALSETTPVSVAPLPAEGSRWDLNPPLEALKRERFSEALQLLQALSPESGTDRDVLLLQAVLLTHRGALAEAQQVCRTLLDLDELHAGAHYVLALCQEGLGDPSAAAEHDQLAAHLDPSFAMPRLHLGLMARRAGDHDVARRELAEAHALLEREDASRLLLFGGGFNREALRAVCRRELLADGGLP